MTDKIENLNTRCANLIETRNKLLTSFNEVNASRESILLNIQKLNGAIEMAEEIKKEFSSNVEGEIVG